MKKDQSGYFRLDLKPKGKDYKSYLEEQASKQGMSVTKYIHRLIDLDMEITESHQERAKDIKERFGELSNENQELLLEVMELMLRDTNKS